MLFYKSKKSFTSLQLQHMIVLNLSCKALGSLTGTVWLAAYALKSTHAMCLEPKQQ